MATNTLGNLIINVEANTKHLVDGFNRAEQKVNSATSSMKAGIKSLVGAYASLQAVDVAKFYATQIDALTHANNRLKLVTTSTKEFISVQKELFSISQETRQSFTTTLDLYARIGLATKDLGKSQKELLPLTDSINKAMIISGGTAQSQAAALVQLGQAFSADFKAVGQELGSLREQAPRLYTALVDGMGVTRDAFKQMAEDGSLSSEIIIAALQRQAYVLNQEFSTMTLTIEQSITVAQNALQNFIGEFDKATGVSKTVSEGIRDIGTGLSSLSPEQIERLTTHIKFAGIAIAGTIASITAYKTAQGAFNAITAMSATHTQSLIKLEGLRADALRKSEKAIIARTLATEASNTATAVGINLTDKQVKGLQTQASSLTKASIAAQDAVAQQTKLAEATSKSAIAMRLFGNLANTLPLVAIATGLATMAASFFNANKDAEKFNETLSKTKEELEKLSKAQIAYNLSMGEQKLGEQLEERRKKALELKRAQFGILTGTKLGDTSGKPLDNAETKRLEAELDAINESIKKTEELKKQLKSIEAERKKATESAAPKEDPRIAAIKETYKKLLSAEQEGSVEYQRLIQEQSDKIRGVLYNSTADMASITKVLDPLKGEIDAINKKYDEQIKKVPKYAEEYNKIVSGYNKAREKEIADAREKANKKSDSDQKEREAEEHKRRQKQLTLIQEDYNAKLKLEEDYQLALDKLADNANENRLSGLAKEALDTYNHYDALITKFSGVAGAEDTLRKMQISAMDDVVKKQKELDEVYANNTAIDSLDEIYGRYEKLIDAQIELAENGMNIDFDFGDGAKELNNISKAMQQLHVGSLKFAKQDIKLQEDFAKRFLEAKGDELKEKQIVAEFDEDSAKLKEAQLSAEMAAYSSLAGAMVGAFEKGSAGAIAFTTLQSALGIASSWAAIANAWALPFPSNIPAVAMVASAVMPIISQLGGSGGGGGSASASQARVDAGQKRVDAVEAEYTPITDRLDRQIELLERLNLGGTAGVVSIESANRSFERDYKVAIEETFRDFRSTFTKADITSAGLDVDEFIADMQAIEDAMNVKGDVFSSYREGGNFLALGEPVLSNNDNMLKFLAEAAKTEYGKYAFSQKEGEGTFAQQADDADIYYNEILNSIFEITAEYANGMLDVVDELRDASSTMKEAYDNITGTAKYQKQELSDAFADVDALRGKSSYTSYLAGQINAIDKLEKEIDTDLISLLLSEDPTRLPEQVEAVRQLGELSGKVFSKGAEDALNYINSIELVSEALASSRENMAEWRQRNETLTDTTKRLAKEAGLENDVKMDSVKSVQNAINVMYKQAWADKLLSDAELEALISAEALKDELQETADAIADEKKALLDQIAVLEGTTTSRELELLGLDASNRALQEKIWLLEDEKAITERTTANIGSFLGGLRTLGQSTAEMASDLNVSAATDVQGLADLYNSFVSDSDFTNDELAFLNSNLKLVEEEQAKAITKTMDGLNGTLADTNKRISSLESTIGAIDDIVGTLKDASSTPETKLKDFYDSLKDASAVFSTSDTSKYEDAISSLSAQSDILSDTSAFGSSLDMKFAQLVASNKLTEFGLKAQSELSRQESISKEVEAQITATQSMSNTLHNDLLMLISSVDKEREDATIASIVPNTLELMPQSPIPVIVQPPSTTTAGEQTQEEVILKLVSEVTRLAKIVARFDDGDAMRVRVS